MGARLLDWCGRRAYLARVLLYQAQGRLEEAAAMYRRPLAIFGSLGDWVTIEQVHALINELEDQRRGG